MSPIPRGRMRRHRKLGPSRGWALTKVLRGCRRRRRALRECDRGPPPVRLRAHRDPHFIEFETPACVIAWHRLHGRVLHVRQLASLIVSRSVTVGSETPKVRRSPRRPLRSWSTRAISSLRSGRRSILLRFSRSQRPQPRCRQRRVPLFVRPLRTIFSLPQRLRARLSETTPITSEGVRLRYLNMNMSRL